MEVPEFDECPYCHQQVKGFKFSPLSGKIQFHCYNHLPLHIEWVYDKRIDDNINGNWYIDGININLSNSFKLHWQLFVSTKDFKDEFFTLFEYKSINDRSEYWNPSQKQFSLKWVLSQSADKIFSILQMYKVFS